MSAPSGRHQLRVVIDTNVLLSTLVFKSGAMVAIKRAWQSGECVPVVSRATTEELLTVLRYPKFELDQLQQEDVLVAYLPYCETLPEPKTRVKLPRCRDEDDEAFLLLAAASKADALITGDKDLLALSKATPFEILGILRVSVNCFAPPHIQSRNAIRRAFQSKKAASAAPVL